MLRELPIKRLKHAERLQSDESGMYWYFLSMTTARHYDQQAVARGDNKEFGSATPKEDLTEAINATAQCTHSP